MEQKRYALISEGIGLLLVTATAFICTYYYEIGQCVYFSIPTDYISFDLSLKGKLLFLLFLVFAHGISFFYYIPLIDKIKIRLLRKGIKILSIVSLIGFVLFSMFTPLIFEALILFGAFFAAIVFWAVIYNKGNVDKVHGVEFWKHELLRIPRGAGVFVTRWLVYSIVGCFVFMNIGFHAGFMTYRFPVTNDGKALVKRYGSTNFFCDTRNDSIIQGRIYVIENASADTLSYKWLKKGGAFWEY